MCGWIKLMLAQNSHMKCMLHTKFHPFSICYHCFFCFVQKTKCFELTETTVRDNNIQTTQKIKKKIIIKLIHLFIANNMLPSSPIYAVHIHTFPFF